MLQSQTISRQRYDKNHRHRLLRMHRMQTRCIAITTQQTGLSMIELMVAMLVGLVLMAGVISIFISTHTGSSVNSAISQLQENGRFSLGFIRDDARVTAYMGCATTLHTINNLNSTQQLYSYNLPVYGLEFNGTKPGDTYPLSGTLLENPVAQSINTGWTPAGDTTLPIFAIPGSDILVLYSATGNPTYTASATTGGTLTFGNSTSGSGIMPNAVLVISDCLKSTVFQAGAATSHMVAIGGGPPGNLSTTFVPSYDSGAQVLPANVVIYYIGQGATNPEPGLFKVQLNTSTGSLGTPQELVPGVENMQIVYGVNGNGNKTNTPSQFLTAQQTDAAGLWSGVISMQVGLLLRSNTGVVSLPAAAAKFNLLGTIITAPIDTRLRRVFTTTIFFRNTSPGF